MKSLISILILIALALIFLIFFHGYQYISYTLLFAAFLIAAFTYFPSKLKIAIAIITAIGLVWFTVCEIPVVKCRKGDANPGRDYLIVLGAAVHGDVPSLSLTHRLEKTLEYMEEYENSVAVVSGGQGEGENMTEARCMKQWLVEHGIDEDRIIEEGKSTSTMENLSFSKDIILKNGGSLDSVAVLSSPYHLYRAKYMAESLGFTGIAGVACVYGYPVYSLGMFIREAFGVTHMWAFGD